MTATPPPYPDPPPGTGKILEVSHERERQRARALKWSARQASLMAAAAAGQLLFDRAGVLRHYPRPGHAGHALAAGRLASLLAAGLLVVTEPYGPGSQRVGVTADGREALRLWRRWRPTLAVKDRTLDCEPLQPLLGGQEATRRARAFAEDQRRREAEREEFYAAMEELHTWEDRDERLWDAWAKVQGITHRLGRQRPVGWAPTDEEAAQHYLAPALVAELRADAAHPQPRPERPAIRPERTQELPPLPPAPYEAEQLSLFGEAG
ncbi:hypothetical protein ABZ543_08285 [Streptomyces roseifaciens]